jgi:predicted unusual protein kinase regulating ubiquinone biosynthesis (AarF/ABC1/UbiB family)
VRISNPSLDFQEMDFRHRIEQLVTEQQNATLSEMDIGKVILEVGRAAANTGHFVPTELIFVGKDLAPLDQVGRILEPEFDPNESVRRNASQILYQGLKSTITEGKAFSTVLEAKQFLARFPRG